MDTLNLVLYGICIVAGIIQTVVFLSADGEVNKYSAALWSFLATGWILIAFGLEYKLGML